MLENNMVHNNSDSYVKMSMADFQKVISETVKETFSIVTPFFGGLQHLDNYTKDSAMSEMEKDMAIIRRRVIIGYNDDGSPVYKHLQAKSFEDLNDRIVQTYIEYGRLNEFLNTNDNSESNKKMLFRDYAEKWMETYKLPKLKPRTYQTYIGYLNTHIYPVFGEQMLEDITIDNIQHFLNARKDVARKSLKNYLDLLSQILDSAVEDKIIAKNPAKSKKVSNPATKAKGREALSKTAIRQIMSELSKLENCREKVMLALLIYTGMRRGEVLGLMWEDIDFEERLIHIQRNVTHPGNPAVVGTPKTKNGVRDISFGENLESILLPNKKESGFIFGGEHPYSRKEFETLMKHIKKKIDLHGATPHVFRHSYLTIAGGENIDLKTLQAMAGHADSQTTSNTYMHVIPEKMKAAGQMMDKLLGDYAHTLH